MDKISPTLFFGIDPSINSTGITVIYADSKQFSTEFAIVKGNKLTKKEQKAQEDNKDCFKYLLYEKKEMKDAVDEYQKQIWKAENLSNIAASIMDFVSEMIYKYDCTNTMFCMEGISYGSVRSSAIMDLAGLNYLIRDRIVGFMNENLIVCPPAEIKSFATGNGNANKDEMIAVFENANQHLSLPKVDDIADSYFMAVHCMQHFNSGLEVKYTNSKKVINKMELPF